MRLSLATRSALLVAGLALAAVPASAGELHRLTQAELDSVTAGQLTLVSQAFGAAAAVGGIDTWTSVLLNTQGTAGGSTASAGASAFASAIALGGGNVATQTGADVQPQADPTVRVFRLNFAPIRVGQPGGLFVGEASGSFAVGFQFVPPAF